MILRKLNDTDIGLLDEWLKTEHVVRWFFKRKRGHIC